jgi:hypothetical protein
METDISAPESLAMSAASFTIEDGEMDLFSVPADLIPEDLPDNVSLGSTSVDESLVESLESTEATSLANEEELAKLKESQTVQRLAELMKKPTMKIPQQKKKTPTPTHVVAPREVIQREDYGIDLKKLRAWNSELAAEQLGSEEYRQEYALAKMKGFMNAIIEIVRLQSWWRMLQIKATFKEWREERNAVRRYFFSAWKQYSGSENLRRRILVGKPFHDWAQEVRYDELIIQYNTYRSIAKPCICALG